MADYRKYGEEIVELHQPVMVEEVIQALGVEAGGRYVDCTLGTGGHAMAILDHASPGGQLLGIDADPKALEIARTRLVPYEESILLVNDNFVNLQKICLEYSFFPVHGILFDLGLSSYQLSEKGRGFSFQHDAPLDMRYSPRQKISAADIVNSYSEAELAGIIRVYGEERHAYRIARRIVEARPIESTGNLARVVEEAVGGRRGRIHPATRTFQALRIVTNNELENLRLALGQAVRLLGPGGRLVILSYHSLEDRLVKLFLSDEAKDCLCPPGTLVCSCHHRASLKILTKKPLKPSAAEVEANPRSRSAHLRAAEKLATRDEPVKARNHLFASSLSLIAN